MKVWFKRILISGVVVLIVALVGLAIFLLTFDPNAYKSKLQEIVYDRYHRTLVIEGDIELSLFPRIGLSVHGVSLSERDSRSTFASVDSARFAVAIWPLLWNRLVVDHVTVNGFKAWVVRGQDAEFNFHDLVARRSPFALAAPASEPSPARSRTLEQSAGKASAPVRLPIAAGDADAPATDLQIDIAGLEMKGGEIHFYDVITGTVARVKKLDVTTGRMTFDQPFDVALRGRLLGDYPVADAGFEGQALVKMDPDQRTFSAQKVNVQMAGRLGELDAKSLTLRGNMAYSGYSEMFSASGLELLVQGGMEGERPVRNLEASLVAPRLKVDRSQLELRVEKLAFRAKGERPDCNFELAFDAPSLSISPDQAKGEAISGTVKVNGPSVLGLSLGLNGLGGNARNLTLKELKVQGALKQGKRVIGFNVSSPAVWDTYQERGGLSAIKGDVRIEAPALSSGSFEFPLIGSVQADLPQDELNSEINAILNGSKLDFKVHARRLHDPRVDFQLDADTLDFNKLFPPAVAEAKPEGDAGKGKDKDKEAKDAAPVPPASDAKQAPQPESTLDLRMLEALDVTGLIRVGEVKARNFEATDLSARLRAVDGVLDISNIALRLYEGRLDGHLHADSENVLRARLAMNGVAMADLLKGLTGQQRLSGTGGLALDLGTRGTTAAQLRGNLNGSVQAAVENGAFQGLDIGRTLREANDVIRNVFSGQLPDLASDFDPGRRTEFDSLQTHIDFAQGIGNVRRLDVSAPPLQISAGSPAILDLVEDRLDMLVNVRIKRSAEGGADLSALHGVTVPLLISGPLAKLAYQIQWKNIGSQVVKQAVQDGLIDLLADKAAREAQAGADEKKGGADGGEKTKDPVKSLGKALKGLLGQ